tara:strand:- start:696 stop:959 length:264 start_codon:yes stop_codon:yes gene_type:complete
MNKDRILNIEKKLTDSFSPDHLVIKDQSHLHTGHHGAKKGLGHYEIIITSKIFQKLNRVECHRLIFESLGEMMVTDIHALKIKITND